jgi:hypothetical protein
MALLLSTHRFLSTRIEQRNQYIVEMLMKT